MLMHPLSEGWEETYLVIFNSNILLSTLRLLRNLHKETTHQSASDVGIVILIFEWRAD